MYDLAGNLEQEFLALSDAAKFLQENKITPTINTKGIVVHLRDCANGKRKSAYKKSWKWKD